MSEKHNLSSYVYADASVRSGPLPASHHPYEVGTTLALSNLNNFDAAHRSVIIRSLNNPSLFSLNIVVEDVGTHPPQKKSMILKVYDYEHRYAVMDYNPSDLAKYGEDVEASVYDCFLKEREIFRRCKDIQTIVFPKLIEVVKVHSFHRTRPPQTSTSPYHCPGLLLEYVEGTPLKEMIRQPNAYDELTLDNLFDDALRISTELNKLGVRNRELDFVGFVVRKAQNINSSSEIVVVDFDNHYIGEPSLATFEEDASSSDSFFDITEEEKRRLETLEAKEDDEIDIDSVCGGQQQTIGPKLVKKAFEKLLENEGNISWSIEEITHHEFYTLRQLGYSAACKFCLVNDSLGVSILVINEGCWIRMSEDREKTEVISNDFTEGLEELQVNRLC